MSYFFYSDQENNNNKESINKYKDLFLNYEKEKPSLSQALDQMFISSNADSIQSKDLVDDILFQCQSTINKNLKRIKQVYPDISMEDANIICSYTCESKKDKKFSPYRLLNSNLVSENRKNGIEKISKYLYILLKSLRKLKRYYPDKENKNLYRCIPNKVSLSIDPNNPNYIPYKRGNIKTFWGCTSTSTKNSEAYNFLGENHQIKTGTIFKLEGNIWGYDITLFNYFGENEILLEPERKYKITDAWSFLDDIIIIHCKVFTTPLVLDNNISCEYDIDNIKNTNDINNDNNEEGKLIEIDEDKKECICKIDQEIRIRGMNKHVTGLGILCNIPSKNMKAFITYYHVIDSEFLNNEQKIVYYNHKKEKKEINIKSNRYKYTNKEIDITIIEIIEEEDKIKKYLEIDDCINSRNYNDKEIVYIKFNEDILDYERGVIIKKDEEYIINKVCQEGIILLKKNLELIGVYNNKEYIHMNKILNSINFIIGKIEITTEDIGKEIQLINNKNEYDYGINDDIEKNIIIIINGKIKKNILTYTFETVGVKKIYYISEDLTNMSYMFSDCCKLKEINLASFDTSKVTKMTYMFWGCFGLEQINLQESFDTSQVTNMSGMFGGCSRLKEIKLPESFDTSQVTNMSYMFSRCSGLEKIDFPNEKFNTARVTNMQEMFFNCSALKKIFLQESFVTDKVVNMSYMFSGCSKLKNIYMKKPFNTNQVNNMSCMFSGCSELNELNLESFRTIPDVTNISCIFKDIPRSCNFKCQDINLINQFKNETACFIF